MADSGILYVLTNASMPGLAKIGCTVGIVQDRIKNLNARRVFRLRSNVAASGSDYRMFEGKHWM